MANDPPAAPVPLSPADGATVGTATPALRIQNATDADHDRLTYEFVVTDADTGAVVASALGVPEASPATSWTVDAPLAENARFRWQARASDRQFDECDLTLKKLDTIGEVLTRRIMTTMHARITYPERPAAKEASNVIRIQGMRE